MDKRIEQLKEKVTELKESDNELPKVLEPVVEFFDETKDIRMNGEVKVEIRRLVYKLHDEFVIEGDDE